MVKAFLGLSVAFLLLEGQCTSLTTPQVCFGYVWSPNSVLSLISSPGCLVQTMHGLLAIPVRAAVNGSGIVLLMAETTLNNYKQRLDTNKDGDTLSLHIWYFLHTP